MTDLCMCVPKQKYTGVIERYGYLRDTKWGPSKDNEIGSSWGIEEDSENSCRLVTKGYIIFAQTEIDKGQILGKKRERLIIFG